MYCSQLIRDERAANVHDPTVAADASKALVSNHNAQYDELSAMEQARYMELAQQETVKLRKEERALAQEICGELQVIEMRSRENNGNASSGSSNTLVAHRFSSEDLTQLVARWNESEFEGDAGREYFNNLVTAPEATVPLMQELILETEKEIEHEEPKSTAWWWADRICRHRDYFERTAISFGDEPYVYRLLYAKMQPHIATFLRLCKVDPELPEFEVVPFGGDLNWDPQHKLFLNSDDFYVCGRDMPEARDVDVYVWPNMRWHGNGAVTRREPVLFEDWMQQVPRDPPAEPAAADRAARIRRDERDRLLEEFPWLTDADLGLVAQPRRHGGHGGRGGGHDPDPVAPAPPVPVPLLDDGEIWRRLEEKREELDLGIYDDLYFYVRITGGKWTHEHLGKVYDTATMFARACTKPWCDRFRWNKQKGFGFTAHGGEEAATMLAHEWQGRGDHFYKLFLAGGGDLETFRYTDADLDSYQSSESFINWAADQDIDADCFDGIMEVRHAVPTNP